MPNPEQATAHPVDDIDFAIACDARLGSYFRYLTDVAYIDCDYSAALGALNAVVDRSPTTGHSEIFLKSLILLASDDMGLEERHKSAGQTHHEDCTGVFDHRTSEVIVAAFSNGGAEEYDVMQKTAVHELRHASEQDNPQYNYWQELSMTRGQNPDYSEDTHPREARAYRAEEQALYLDPIWSFVYR